MVVIKAVLSVAVKPGSFLVSYSGISYFLLLVLAAGLASRNAARNTLGGRLFWALLAAAFGLWGAHEGIQLYYELGLHTEVPNNSIADSLLFLHLTLFMAAVATLPHRNAPDRKPYAPVLNALLVVFFWILLYGYAVFPYQFLTPNPAPFTYDLRFDILYLCGNVALIAMIALSFWSVKAPWKSVYLNLSGAATLYALSSTIANLEIDYLGGYVNGKLYGLGLIASVCWFVWIPLCAWQAPQAETNLIPFDGNQSSKASVWAMLVVVSFSIPVVWELLKRNENDGLRTLRVVFAVAMIVCLASAAYAREYLAKRELASHFGFANDQLHLAMQAGSAVVWVSDLKCGRDVLFGDLQTIFGFPPEVSTSSAADLVRYVHPDDQQQFSEALANARQNHRLFAREFRMVRPDGAIRWLDAHGKFYYAKDGTPERMIGFSLDITQRKQAEEALSGMTRKLIEAQEQERTRIARDLHDDIAQRLALLDIDLQEFESAAKDDGLRKGLAELRNQVQDVVTNVQTLSHELYSSKLEYLGLVAAVKGFCAEFRIHQRAEIEFRSHDLPTDVPQEISLCLFRVLQQALHNAVKHSGAKRFEVQLWGSATEIHLSVSDLGIGFDVETALKSHGIGLLSMKERMRLVSGELSIDSQPRRGTTIHARAPFRSGGEFARVG
jgi:PAS domain S-box-containing protein